MADKCIQMLGTSVTSMFSHHPAIKAPSCSINGLCSQPRDRSSVLKKKFAWAGGVFLRLGNFPSSFSSREKPLSLEGRSANLSQFISDAKWRFSIQLCRSIYIYIISSEDNPGHHMIGAKSFSSLISLILCKRFGSIFCTIFWNFKEFHLYIGIARSGMILEN